MPETRRIGLAVDAVASYGRGIIRGVITYARSNPRWVITVEPQWSFSTPPAIEKWDVDGLIVQTFSREFEDRVLALGIPATNVSNIVGDQQRIPTAIPDDLAVGRLGAEYLLGLGFRELAFAWPGDSPYGKLRLEGFKSTCAQAGVPVHVWDRKSQPLTHWISQLPKPIGILGCNDDWAHRVLNACRTAGVRVPDQVAVLGVDNDELFNVLVTPSLSSIALPAEQIGFEASAQLDRMMNGETLPQGHTLLPPLRVVVRNSTDVLSIEDEDVILAVRFIREHSSQPIQVDDVLEHVPLTRRSLERRFRKFVGRSISEEIRRAHVERAKKLLTSTDLAMPQVASASGFTTATRLGIVFQKEVGESPSQFRKRARVAGQPKD